MVVSGDEDDRLLLGRALLVVGALLMLMFAFSCDEEVADSASGGIVGGS